MVLASETQCTPKSGPTDEGQSIIAKLLTGAAILAAAYNTAKAVEIANDQWDMAKRYWKIAHNWLDHYRNNYAPVEDQEVNEALNIPVTEPEYETARGRSRVIAYLEFKGVVEKTIRCTSEYCTGLREDMLEDLVSAQANAVALADGLGYRNERAYVESRNDVRFDKMLNTAKRGRDMVADNVSMAQATAKAYGDAFEQTWNGLRGSAYFLGYMGARNPTAYPTSYLSSASGNAGNDPAGVAISELRHMREVQQSGESLLTQQATYNWG